MSIDRQKSIPMNFRVLPAEKTLIMKMAKEREMSFTAMVKVLIKREFLKGALLKEKGSINMDDEKAWEYALGIIKVDGLEPSSDLLELIIREKRGEITTKDMINILIEKYKKKADEGNV